MKKTLFTLLFAVIFFTKIWSQDYMLGEIKMFAGNYAPQGWVLCNGQILQVSQYSALFSLLGTTYGGNGSTTFAVPNLCGRVPIGMGSGTNLTTKTLGSTGGAETVTLTATQIPAHTHELTETTATATTSVPSPTVVPATAQLPASGASSAKSVNVYAPSSGNPTVTSSTTSSGGNQAHENMMPYLTINYIICVAGIYPSRP